MTHSFRWWTQTEAGGREVAVIFWIAVAFFALIVWVFRRAK